MISKLALYFYFIVLVNMEGYVRSIFDETHAQCAHSIQTLQLVPRHASRSKKDNVLSQRNDDLHASTRSKMAAAYSGKEVDNIETTVDQNVERLLELLDTEYIAKGKPIDF